jgi:hypothetical protein
MPFTWMLRTGLVVHRESVPLSKLPNPSGRDEDSFIRLLEGEALFAGYRSAWSDEGGMVTKGSVVIKGGHAEIVYRAPLGTIIFLLVWFGLLIAGEIGLLFFTPEKPVAPMLVLAGLIVGGALLVPFAIRAGVGRLRGIALEAAIRLRDRR